MQSSMVKKPRSNEQKKSPMAYKTNHSCDETLLFFENVLRLIR